MKRLLLLLAPLLIAQTPPTFYSNTNVVVVNVSVLDRNGKPVENLTKNDFQLFEDGKPQKLQAVDFERLSNAPAPATAPIQPPPSFNPNAPQPVSPALRYQDRRLMVLLFDFSSMQPAEQMRAKQAAIRFLRTQMTASDMVSIMNYGATLQTVENFTADRDRLIADIEKFRIGDSSENASVADEGADSQDQSGTFTADETEFNIFNADLKLAALEDAARQLGQYPEKKALIYISSGIQKNGVDNQAQLRATVNTAVRSNVAFYPIDARGLSTLIPGGDATQQGAAGTGLFNGSGQRSLRENFTNQQETLSTLAADTGGKALLDSNDLTEGIRQVQTDFSSYYVLTYVSSNPAQDGKYRKIQVKLTGDAAQLRAKLDYRQGYYAPVTFGHMQDEDKEAQLSQALLAGNPITALPMAVEADYFRLGKSKYFVPISVKIPGSALEFRSKGSKSATALDFIAQVSDPRGHPASMVRDTISLKLNQDTAGQVSQKSIQYDTGVTLAPGAYTLRVVARENGEGKIGSFETALNIPDLDSEKTLRTSSLVLSYLREPASEQIGGVKNDNKLVAQNPLIENGQKLVPNVTKVFHAGQRLIAFMEVYDVQTATNVQATLALFQGNKKIFETRPAVPSSELLDGGLPLQFALPLNSLPHGEYVCQLNVIDAAGHRFAFPREHMTILP